MLSIKNSLMEWKYKVELRFFNYYMQEILHRYHTMALIHAITTYVNKVKKAHLVSLLSILYKKAATGTVNEAIAWKFSL